MIRRISPRILLILIAALFLLPLLLAWLMYNGTIDYKPATTRNLGKLVDPPLPITWENVKVINPSGTGVTPAEDLLAKHWVALKPLPAVCDDPCMRQVVELRQIHLTTGRNQSRVRIALLLAEQTSPETISQLRNAYAKFNLITSPDGALESGMRRAAGENAAIYLIDPLGNIMMVYTAGADPNHLKKDLKRLLTWSKLDE